MEKLKPWPDIIINPEKDGVTEKQRQIIIAVIELFGEKGFAGTSTKEIAQRAQVAEGTIFKHFATKKDLLMDISALILNNMLLPIISYGLEDLMKKPHASLEKFFTAIFDNRLELIENYIVLLKVLLQESLFQPEIRMALIEKLHNLPLTEGLENLKTRGLIIDRPTNELFIMFMTSLFSFIFTRYLFLPEMFVMDQESDRQNYIQFLTRAFSPLKNGHKEVTP